MTMVAAQRQQRWFNDNGGGSLRRRLHTDRMVVCLKLDGCCLYCALSNSVIVYRTLLILDGNSRNVGFFQYPCRHQLPTDQLIANFMTSGGIVFRWKLDGDDVADESALIRTFLIID